MSHILSRLSQRKSVRFGVLASVSVVVVAAVVLTAQWLQSLPSIQDFIVSYPGNTSLPSGSPVGLPVWLGWQHFLSAFLLLLIVRTGWEVRTVTRPTVYWTPRVGRRRARISLSLWLHLALDLLWIINGAVFVVLLFVTGQWVRIVPTEWGVFPNAISVAIQYASLNWPTEDGWVNYNSLQQIAYFLTVFVAAPLAIVSGLRMSPLWPGGARPVNRLFPASVARAVHFPVMLYFVLFTVTHVTLVLATGALRNLNHMYASRDEISWVGFGLFACSMVVMAGGFVLARPVFIRPVASLTGKLSRER